MTAAAIEISIREAIEARVATLPMAETYPVVWSDGPTYSPDAKKAWIRASFFPNTTRRMFIGSGDPHQRLSLLQIDFMAPKTWPAMSSIQVAGEIAAHFPADLRMTFGDVSCRVTSAPHVAAPMAGDSFIQVPVTVPIETFA